MPLILIANTVTGGEKAWGLYEVHEMAPNKRAFHRYQIIEVLRDGRVAQFRKDMGLAKMFRGINQINIPSFLEHSVDELLDMADEFRGEPKIDVLELLSLDHYKPA